MRQPASLLSEPGWQDGGHGARMAHQGLREQQHQQRGLDISRDRRPSSHLPHAGSGGVGVLRVPTRERGYTIAAGYAASRRSPFDADGGVGDGGGSGGSGSGRSVALQQHPGYGDRPRSKSSSHFHASLAAAAAAVGAAAGAAAGSSEHQEYVDARNVIPPVHHYRDRDHHHHHRPARLHPALAGGGGGGSMGSQDLHHHRSASDMPSVPVGVAARGGLHNVSPSTQHHHHLHPLRGGASRGVLTGRPYSASPDISAGRRLGRREAFSVGNGDGGNGDGGNGNGSVPLSRSASCHPFGEQPQPQPQQPVGGGAGGGNRGTGVLRSPPWERRASVEDNADTTVGLKGYSSLGALDFPGSEWEDLTAAAPFAGGLGDRHMSSASLHRARLSGTTSVFDGHRSSQRQQQPQRWEQPGVLDRAMDAPVMMKVRAATAV